MASALRGGGRPRLQQNTQVAVGAPRTLNCLLKHHKVFNLHSTVRNGSEGEGEHRLPSIKEYNYTRLSSIKWVGVSTGNVKSVCLNHKREFGKWLRGIAPWRCVVFLGRWRVYYWLNCPWEYSTLSHYKYTPLCCITGSKEKRPSPKIKELCD